MVLKGISQEDKTISDIIRFLKNCKNQSFETEADRDCLLINVEKIIRRKLGQERFAKIILESIE